MANQRKLKILSPILVAIAGILLAYDLLSHEASFVNLYLHGGMLVFGVYMFLVTLKQGRASEDAPRAKPLSLRLFIVLACVGLLFAAVLLYYFKAHPVWIVLVAMGVTAVFLMILGVAARRRDNLGR